jgi:diaminopimelate epimerase
MVGVPIFEPDRIPFLADRRAATYLLEVAGRKVEISAVSLGNPHAVRIVTDIDAAPVASEGPLIQGHPRFPDQVNAGYMQIVDRGHIKLRVYERGAGETLSCGTGACAAAVAGIERGLLDSPVHVDTRGGVLEIAWTGAAHPVSLTGPAQSVFEGEIEV